MSPIARFFCFFLLSCAALLEASSPLLANIRGTQSTPAVVKIPVSLKVDVDLTTQKMKVLENGTLLHTWKISSGKSSQFRTPLGTFTPQWMTPMWYSRQWSWTPMPYSIFINDGVAIHGTSDIGRLGRPASKGCIRLSPANAKILYKLVERHGLKATRVTVLGTPEYLNQRVSSTSPQSEGETRTSYPQKRSERTLTSAAEKNVARVKYTARYPERLEILKGTQGSLSVYGGF